MHIVVGALGASPLGLPVVVAGAGVLVAVGARRHAQARRAALPAEEEARLPVRRPRAPRRAPAAALCCKTRTHAAQQHLQYYVLLYSIRRRRAIQRGVITHTHTHGPWGWRLPGVTPYCK